MGSKRIAPQAGFLLNGEPTDGAGRFLQVGAAAELSAIALGKSPDVAH